MGRYFVQFGLLGSLLLATACASSPTGSHQPEVVPDRVISRSDDLSKRPQWLKETEPFRVENGRVQSLGMAEIPGDHRVEAGYRIAENNSKISIASAIEQRLEYVFQQAQEDTSMDSSLARAIGAEATKLVTSSLQLENRYWEKVVITTDTGEQRVRYRIFARISMPEIEFKKAIQRAIKKHEGRGGLSEDFSKKVNDHWDQFTSPQDPPRSAASTQE